MKEVIFNVADYKTPYETYKDFTRTSSLSLTVSIILTLPKCRICIFMPIF